MPRTIYPTLLDEYNKKPKINLGKQISWWRRKSSGGYGNFNIELYMKVLETKESA